MDVDSFIQAYRDDWKRLEAACARGPRGLAQLGGAEIEAVAALYERVSGHFAEVQTRYRDPELRAYLNRIVAEAHAALYGARARTPRDAVRLFGPHYRAAVTRTLPWIGVAAVLLLGSMAATTTWIASSPSARAGVLPGYVRDAVRELDGGSFNAAPSEFTTAILLNNVQVSLLAFALGITFGIGTVWVLLQNGILIGTLAGASHAAGMGSTFWTLVLPHGFLELIAITIAAGAGLRLGWSLIEPGDRTRGRALTEEARDAIIVLVGVIPAFALAALYEGYLTLADLPAALRIGVGATTAAVYLLFLLLPARRAEARDAGAPAGPAVLLRAPSTASRGVDEDHEEQDLTGARMP